MGLNPTTDIFDRMDSWRHLPGYQLERRADLLFSLYLPEALGKKLGRPVVPALIPEFPVRVGTVYPETRSNKSFKIDYLALTEDRAAAVFVELKTDARSRRTEQDRYLGAAREAGLARLLEGLLDIFRASSAKRKYFCLLQLAEKLGLLRIPERLRGLVLEKSLTGINQASRDVEITCAAAETRIVYLQPKGSGEDVLNFTEFAETVRAHPDGLSQRFAQSLGEWAMVEPGR